MRPLYKRFLDKMSTTVKSMAAPAEQTMKKSEASGTNATTTVPVPSGNWAKLQKVSSGRDGSVAHGKFTNSVVQTLPKDVKSKDPKFTKDGNRGGKAKAMGLAAYASRVRGADEKTDDTKSTAPATGGSKWKGKEKDDSKLPPWKR
jgi:hypothetical protein